MSPRQHSSFLSEPISATEILPAIQQGKSLAQANLPGINLSKMDLSGIDFSGANLIGANLSQTNLQGANLKGVDLRKAKSQRRQFEWSEFRRKLSFSCRFTGL